jgi:hypothetical protein
MMHGRYGGSYPDPSVSNEVRELPFEKIIATQPPWWVKDEIEALPNPPQSKPKRPRKRYY